jgi:hypothetical protein
MRRFGLVAIVFFCVTCAKEQPDERKTVPATTAAPVNVPAPVSPAIGTYEQAMDWMRTTRGFHFDLRDGAVHATGDMVREAQRKETVRVTMAGAEWIATVKPNGVVWFRAEGGGWKAADQAPVDGPRIYQRVTLALDPQKVEGEAQYVRTEGDLNEWRFTNAITREVHRLWIDPRGNHIARMVIESNERPVELKITNPNQTIAVPKV